MHLSPREGIEAAAPEDLERARLLHRAYADLRRGIGKVIIGQEDVVELLLIALFSGGHSVLIGLPGLAKTLLVRTIARLLDLVFRRIQFTPDLMPTDITGTDILQEDPETGVRAFRFLRGPIFTNMLLADEINRTPPRTQAALLEAMQERRVTVGERTFDLPSPFFVVATQNPIEQEGTYPLPEAQLDRFLLAIRVAYPSEEEELAILKLTEPAESVALEKVIGPAEILAIQGLVPLVPAADHVLRYVLRLVRSTRPEDPAATPIVKEYLSFGAGPRAAQHLVLAAKARALLRGRFHVNVEDVSAVALPVLAHRIVTNFHAGAEGMSGERVVARLVAELRPDSPGGAPRAEA